MTSTTSSNKSLITCMCLLHRFLNDYIHALKAGKFIVHKAFHLDIYFFFFILHLLGFTVSMTTLNYMQNTRMRFLVISFIGDIYLK